ncbi:hypothetical protein [Oceanirhabdus sp. W0125-5]|uniref:hypothetical protein n=1 Tax=Oceanirhabdus sp. W0125-5 TaxID=2999116 RepID=UPI0022F2F0E6|nr:hypothetical protein [Oceanirhabdus sp. W0125-5]WBW97633.1 hypothetical protein OW730_02260 [Oceanirhabdus sp. W0125-5]
MKVKSWIKYLVYTCLILILVRWGQYIFLIILKNNQKLNFRPFYNTAMYISFYGSIGVFFGLEHFLSEIKKKGKWMVNLPKIIFMGIPSLYFSFGIAIYCIDNPIIRDFLAYPIGVLLMNGSVFMPVFQMTLGYSIITCFYKDNKKLLV